MAVKFIGVAEDGESDGSHAVRLSVDGEDVELFLTLEQTQLILNRFQTAAIRRNEAGPETLSVPQLRTFDFQAAHQRQTEALMATTLEMGQIVLMLENDTALERLSDAVGRLKQLRGAPKGVQ